MNKIMMTLAAVAVAATMNAQGYIGGNLGFNTSKDKTTPGTEVTLTGFNIAPELGYKLDDKLGVGVVLGFSLNNHKTEVTGQETIERKVTTFQIKPYLRYQVLTYGKANVFVDGGLNFAMAKTKDYKAAMDLGLFVTPGISYDINDTWTIAAKLNNMFSFGYHKDAVADVEGAPDAPTDINLGLSTGGFNVGSLTFAVYYNF